EGGLERMYYSVSDTAEYGGMTRGEHVVNEETKKRVQEVLDKVVDGRFAKEWIDENKQGTPNLKKHREDHQSLELEKVGKQLRSMMDWITVDDDDNVEEAAE